MRTRHLRERPQQAESDFGDSVLADACHAASQRYNACQLPTFSFASVRLPQPEISRNLTNRMENFPNTLDPVFSLRSIVFATHSGVKGGLLVGLGGGSRNWRPLRGHHSPRGIPYSGPSRHARKEHGEGMKGLLRSVESEDNRRTRGTRVAGGSEKLPRGTPWSLKG